MATTKETVVIGGHLKAREAGSGLPFQKVGLVSTIQHTTETNSLSLADTTTPQGGEYDSLDRVTSVGLSINFREIYTWVLAAWSGAAPPASPPPPSPARSTPPPPPAPSPWSGCPWPSPA